MTTAGATTSRPGAAMVHPIAVASLALLALNDQVLKRVWPGPVTGKLSDLAGLVVAPLVVLSTWEIGLWVAGRWRGPTGAALFAAVVLVGVVFALVQVWPPATDAYRWGLGSLQALLGSIAAGVGGGTVGVITPVRAVGDLEDLVALPALAVSWWVGRRRLDPD